MNIHAILRQHAPLPPKFEDGDQLWIVQAIPEAEDLPIGYVRILVDESNARLPVIEYVIVHPGHRRGGVAKSLIKSVISKWGRVDIAGPTTEEGEAFICALRKDPEVNSKIRNVL